MRDYANLVSIHILFLALLFSLLPRLAFGAVYLDQSSFKKSITLKKQNAPYHISSDISVPKGVTVKVDPGVSLIFDSGSITIRGSLYLQGTEDSSVSVIQKAESKGFTVIGGVLQGSYVGSAGGSIFLDAYSSSTVSFSNLKITDTASVTGALISVWRDSILSLKDSSISNIQSTRAIDVFMGSSLILDSVEFSHAGRDKSISVFGNLIQDGKKMRSTIGVANSVFDGAGQARGAIEVFDDAFLLLENSTLQNFVGSALFVNSEAEARISQGKFLKNGKGIEAYDSTVVADESDFEGNAEYAVIHGGGSFEGADNWWGDSSGPYSLDKNPSGEGDSFYGTGNIAPWLEEKKKSPCCSSVLFIPGLQGSRIYKRSLFNREKQLWEPGSNGDVSKLFMDAAGEPMDKTLYEKDIIGTTNIGFGRFDVEIYEGFIHAMNKLEANFSIRDWTYFPYDWRSSPNAVAVSGAKIAPDSSANTGGSTNAGVKASDPQFRTMESEVIRLAASSKTKKVSLIAHSYGGLVAKRFLAYLASKGKAGLIDKTIFVGVPEQGTPSALFALLHGDNQEIGNGYILNKTTARTLAQNMPSTYALLPSENASLIKGMAFIPATASEIGFSVPDVANISDMYKFILGKTIRPSTKDMSENFIPSIGNSYVANKIDLEKSLYKEQGDPAYKDILFYNILGTGLNTLSSVTYEKDQCPPSLFSALLIPSPYCGLDHVPSYSKLGDATVLLGNLEKRWGDKYLFDMSSYNRDNSKNYSHASMMSANPTISAIMQMLLGHMGYYQIPKYISHYENGDSSHPAPSPTYVLSASESLALSSKDAEGKTSGADLQYIRQNQGKLLDVLPIHNTQRNSSYAEVGNSAYLLTESIPKEIDAIPLPGSQTGGVSLENQILKEVDISLRKLELENETTVFEFKGIPVTEYTSIDIQVNTASTVPAVLYATQHIDGVYDETKAYLPKGFDVNPGNDRDQSGGVAVTDVSTPLGATGLASPADIGYIIASVRSALVSSSLRTNFKNRYLLKLKAIENYSNSAKPSAEKARSSARKLSKETITSLASIIKDLSRYRAFYYKGGMQKGEAVFLYSQFARLSRAYGDI